MNHKRKGKSTPPRILWLRPTKPSNISVGRKRIAAYLERDGYTVDFADASGKDAFSAVKRALTHDYDVILGTVRMGLYVGLPLSKALRVPFIGDVTDPIEQISHLPNFLYKFLYVYEHIALSFADECFFTYTSSYNTARERGISGIKVYNGVDFQRFDNPDKSVVKKAASILEESGVDISKQIAIYIGGLSPVYHIREILEAADYTNHWEFVFIGSGQLEEEVQSAQDNLENLHYLGSFEYDLMPGFLAHADVGFCLVDAEQPLKVLEYGAAGVATLAIPGELRTRFSEDNLLFIQPNDRAISETLNWLARNSFEIDEYGQNLHEKAKQFDWASVASEYRDAIRELTDET